MNILILYYSRTGTTKIVADKIASLMNATCEEVVDKKNRSGINGYIVGGRDALKKSLTEIENIKNELNTYDLVIFGTPVWVGTMAPAIRTVITENKDKLSKLAFFSTQGSKKLQKVFNDMEEICGLKASQIMYLSTQEVKRGKMDDKVKAFVEALKK